MNTREWTLHCLTEALKSLTIATMYLDSASTRGGVGDLVPLADEIQAKAREVRRIKEKLEKE